MEFLLCVRRETNVVNDDGKVPFACNVSFFPHVRAFVSAQAVIYEDLIFNMHAHQIPSMAARFRQKR
jgi:hypothetical protein